MAWSRIDSGFWRHPKFSGWTAAQKWALGELIGYCCEYRTDGHVPNDLGLLPRSVTKPLLTQAIQCGWLDVEADGSLRFHDWNEYHPKDPTGADRVRKHRNQKRYTTVTEPVTTNTSTKTNTKPKAFGGKHERNRPVRAAQEDPNGPVSGTGEDHGSVVRLERTTPPEHDQAHLSEVRHLIQEQFGT